MVAIAAKRWQDKGREELLSVYSDETRRPIDLDLRGSAEEVIGRLGVHEPERADEMVIKRTGPGRVGRGSGSSPKR